MNQFLRNKSHTKISHILVFPLSSSLIVLKTLKVLFFVYINSKISLQVNSKNKICDLIEGGGKAES